MTSGSFPDLTTPKSIFRFAPESIVRSLRRVRFVPLADIDLLAPKVSLIVPFAIAWERRRVLRVPPTLAKMHKTGLASLQNIKPTAFVSNKGETSYDWVAT
jgi:hypothetical protein